VGFGGLSFLDRPCFGLSDGELHTRLTTIVALERTLAAARLETVQALASRGAEARRGYASTRAWLQNDLKLAGATAGAMAYLAKHLPDLPVVAAALSGGSVSEAQALTIAKAIDSIRREASLEEQAKAEQILVEQAAFRTPEELTTLGKRIFAHVSPEAADAAERRQAEAEERNAWDTRTLSLVNDSSGRVRLTAWLTLEAAALLRTVLDPLSSPARHRTPDSPYTGSGPAAPWAPNRPASPWSPADPLRPCPHTGEAPQPDDPFGLPPGPCPACTTATERPGVGNAFKDHRNAGQRRHDALAEACELLLATEDLPENGGSKPQLTLTLPYDVLNNELKAGTLETGEQLTAETVRRLACDAGIIPAVLNGQGLPLDLGRERRLIGGALRRALILRDKGCTFPGCDRPPRWCQGHHAKHWADGGETSLGNSLLLCGFHHRLVHHNDWEIVFAADGHPEFKPPSYLDPDRRPQRNLYWQRE